ncbi:MAG: SGNH/GDSL hydrolase family protein [Chloroflexota bacterium]
MTEWQNDKMMDLSRPMRLLLFFIGLFICVLAIIYNPTVLAFLDTDPPVEKVLDKVTTARWWLASVGIGFLIIGKITVRSSLWQKQRLVNGLISMLAVMLPLGLAEIVLKPFARDEVTTIFMRDTDLGWRLRPNASGTWGGVPIKINGKGLRGPELDYAKRDGVFRILYLGDSVTFGFLIELDTDTFPYETETRLESSLDRELETINAGVGGYSPWQAHRFLTQEGLQYKPDLILYSFVLNDVTEKFDLARFGGTGQGYQVTHTAFSSLDHWATYSSVLYHLKRWGLSLRSQVDVQTMARLQEKVDVQMLAYQPHHADVQTAWQLTLENLDQIYRVTEQANIPFALVIFPFTFQFEDIDTLSSPQRILGHFAAERAVPTLDLLPLLAAKMMADDLPPEAYFFDEDHLSHYGSEVVADILVAFLMAEDLVE